jgi:hypothetical protein
MISVILEKKIIPANVKCAKMSLAAPHKTSQRLVISVYGPTGGVGSTRRCSDKALQ